MVVGVGRYAQGTNGLRAPKDGAVGGFVGVSAASGSSTPPTRAFEFRICRACQTHCDAEPDGATYRSLALLLTLSLACLGAPMLSVIWFPAALALYRWRKAAARAGRGPSGPSGTRTSRSCDLSPRR